MSELVTNAVLHANTQIEVVVTPTTEGVRIGIWDKHPGLPSMREYGGYATTGRGLALVAALAVDVGVDASADFGKCVWFTLDSQHSTDDVELGPAEWDIDELLGERPATADDEPGPIIVLLGLPVLLWLAAQQHHDAVLRELVLHRAEHPRVDQQANLEAAQQTEALLASAVDQAVHRLGPSNLPVHRLPPGHPSPLAPALEALDGEVAEVLGQDAQFAALQDILDEAEALAAAGRMLVRPALPEIIAVRDWCCEQAIAQSQGVPAAAWAGTDREIFTRADSNRFETSAPVWDDRIVRESDRFALAADDNNRLVAVSQPIAEALGWTVGELLGRRVVALVPPRYREAHVAGFTRHLTTGEAHALGVPLDLPVLHRDGREILFTFLIEQAAASPGRTVYVAWLTRTES